jgi:hypothetical protein
MAVSIGTKGFLYSKWQGRFEVQEGYVMASNYSHWLGRFVIKQGHKEKNLQCALESGEVYNAVVWLPERDDEKARQLFIEREASIIEDLKRKIKRHEQAIQTLKEAVL